MTTARSFCSDGPVDPEVHYSVPPLERWDLDEVLNLVREKRYFAVRAPGRSGQTTYPLALRDLLNGGSGGNFRCAYASLRLGGHASETASAVLRRLLRALAIAAGETLGDMWAADEGQAVLEVVGPEQAFGEFLRRWAMRVPKPLVLLIDDVDALDVDILLSLVRQLHEGYGERPKGFPQCVVL